MTVDEPSADHAVACARCGTVAPHGAPLEWTMQTSRGGRIEFLCATCARTHVRSIEARLDPEWW